MRPRIHGSKQTKARLASVATLGLALVVVGALSNARPRVSAAAATLCLVTLVFSWWLEVPERRCSFCWRPRAEVAQLVAGPSASLCDDCIVASGATLNGAARGDEAMAAARRALDSPDCEPRALHNLASATLEARSELEPAALRALLADVTRASTQLCLRPAGGPLDRVVAVMLGTRAELHRRLGEGAAAAEALREASATRWPRRREARGRRSARPGRRAVGRRAPPLPRRTRARAPPVAGVREGQRPARGARFLKRFSRSRRTCR